MANKYKTDLVEAITELDEMAAAQQDLEVRIARQKKKVAALTELVNAEKDGEGPTGLVEGITDACRTVLMGAEKPLSPSDVRDRIGPLGLPPQKNLLASVHTVLRRLAKSEPRVEEIAGEGGAFVYRWVQTLPSFLRSSLLMKQLTIEREGPPKKKKFTRI